MKIIRPVIITDGMLVSDVPITETKWVAGTYAEGDQRYIGTDIYEVVSTDPTSDDPLDGIKKEIPTWIKVGAINKFRMFDLIIGSPTIQENGPINLEVTPNEVLNSLMFFNLRALSVRVRMVDPVAGEVYDSTVSLSGSDGMGSWWKFFFGQATRSDTANFLDLPLYRDATIFIHIENIPGEDTDVGEIAMGRQTRIGRTMMNFTHGIEDFSRKERDAFGNFVIVERRFAKVATYDIFLTNFQVNQAFRLLSEVRATPTVYIGDENKPETVTIGFYKSFSTLRTGPHSSEMTLETESLT